MKSRILNIENIPRKTVFTMDKKIAEQRAKERHRTHQREGHKTAEWESLAEWMREELIYREMNRDG